MRLPTRGFCGSVALAVLLSACSGGGQGAAVPVLSSAQGSVSNGQISTDHTCRYYQHRNESPPASCTGTTPAPPTASPAPPAPTPKASPEATVTASPIASPKATALPTATIPIVTPTPIAAGSHPGSQLPPGPLNGSVPPGTNFNLSTWQIQLPTGSTGSPTTIPSSELVAGYTSAYFFTDATTGAMDFFTPESNCATTPNSAHCRSELQEMNPGGTVVANWSASGTNVLTATLSATSISGTTVIGQIHPIESDTVRPLCELFYSSAGALQMGVEQTIAGGNEVKTTIGTVPVGTRFSYVISLSRGVLSASINGGTPKTFSVGSSFASNFQYYFKAGDYGQGTGSDSVSFYGLNVSHGP